LYRGLDLPVVPVALNSGLFWPRRSLKMRPGTITVEYLPAIPPGRGRRQFMADLEESIEGAAGRLYDEGRQQFFSEISMPQDGPAPGCG
jgi:1-acyl-sn-glycerol-3-phosphate acyltransferase